MTAGKGKYILWLPSWYPNRVLPFNGDFIKRHAEALSIYREVYVIYAIKEKARRGEGYVTVQQNVSGSLHETVIYFRVRSTGIRAIDKVLTAFRYRKIYRDAIRKLIDHQGKPELVHVHVGMPAGMMARWIKKKHGVPYVLSEHWSGFLGEATEQFHHLPKYFQVGWKRVVSASAGISAVSSTLASAIGALFPGMSCRIIPNVIDRRIFYLHAPAERSRRFIHVSGMDELKNPAIIIRAFATVAEKFPNATLEMYGSENPSLIEFVQSLHLSKRITFYPEVPQQQLAEAIAGSAALILYSAYETFGCVIIEANACGVPVIVSELPVFHETVRDGINGLFAGNNDAEQLAKKMMAVIGGEILFNASSIAATAQANYSYEVVGKRFSEWYREILRIEN